MDLDGEYHVAHLRLGLSQFVGVVVQGDAERQRVAALAIAQVDTTVVVLSPSQMVVIVSAAGLDSILRTGGITPVIRIVRIGLGANGHGEAVDVQVDGVGTGAFNRLGAGNTVAM